MDYSLAHVLSLLSSFNDSRFFLSMSAHDFHGEIMDMGATKTKSDDCKSRLPTWSGIGSGEEWKATSNLVRAMCIPLHAMMALDLPMKTVDAINKILRGFL